MRKMKKFSDTVKEQVQQSPTFRQGLLREAVSSFIAGEAGTGKILLSDYIGGTIGFDALSEALNRTSASLVRMLGPRGNPPLSQFLEVIAYLQKIDGTVLEVVNKKAA